MALEIVDGFTAEWDDEDVVITFTDRYGNAESYRITPDSVSTIIDILLDVVETGNEDTCIA